jgi:hypothetical protein
MVAVYDVALAYGGPEEGGWWYTQGERVRACRTFAREDRAEGYCQRLNRRLDYVQRNARPLSSVLSEGRKEAYVFEGCAPDGFPIERPRYG